MCTDEEKSAHRARHKLYDVTRHREDGRNGLERKIKVDGGKFKQPRLREVGSDKLPDRRARLQVKAAECDMRLDVLEDDRLSTGVKPMLTLPTDSIDEEALAQQEEMLPEVYHTWCAPEGVRLVFDPAIDALREQLRKDIGRIEIRLLTASHKSRRQKLKSRHADLRQQLAEVEALAQAV